MVCPEKYSDCPHCRHLWNQVFFKSNVANFLGTGVSPNEIVLALSKFPTCKVWTRVALGYEPVHLRDIRGLMDGQKIPCAEVEVVNAGLTDADLDGLIDFVTGCFSKVKTLTIDGNNFSPQGLARLRPILEGVEISGLFMSAGKPSERLELHGQCERMLSQLHAAKRRSLPDMEQDRRVKEAMRVLGGYVDGALRGKPRDWDLRVFGSGKSGLYNVESSDVDMTVVFGDFQLANDKEEREFSKKVVKNVGYKLKGRFRNVEVLPWPRIPLIRIMDEFGLREINIVVGNDMGLLNSSLLREYCLFDPIVLELGLRVKQWAKTSEVVDSQVLSSYGWILLLVFFLIARVQIVPNLQDLAAFKPASREDLRGEQRTVFWGTAHTFDTRYVSADFARHSLRLPLRPRPLLVEPILAEFFRFYAFQFDWASQSVDIRRPLQALSTRFFEHDDNGNKFMALLDPFEGDTRNLAKGISPGGFNKMKEALQKEARKYLDVV